MCGNRPGTLIDIIGVINTLTLDVAVRELPTY